MNAGIHLMHKPVGPTSFSIVQSCITSAKSARPGKRPKVCHGGTLDPFAHGLLLMLVGDATKLFEQLHAVPKVYEASVRWGVETDNGDPHGRVTREGDSSTLSPQQLDDALAPFIGWQDQTPHPTSAKRIGGERAYLKAHRGETFEMPASRVYLHEANWISHDLPSESRLRIVCRGGYYVRALARDLGRSLGCGAHLTTLHRTAIGPWTDPGPDRFVELHGRELLPWALVRLLSDQEIGELRQGREIAEGKVIAPDWALPPGFPDPQAPVRGFHQDRFAYLLMVDNGRLRGVTALKGC
ncbi:MAG: tRNA pseudouridine(55) synthase TruB [Tepidisphaeraceae bacterium]